MIVGEPEKMSWVYNYKQLVIMTLFKIKNYFLLALLLSLPWQTRLIYDSAYVKGKFWEYGSLSIYGTEILLGFIILLSIIEKFKGQNFRARLGQINWKRFLIILVGIGLFVVYFLNSFNRDLAWQYLNWIIYTICLVFILLTSQFSFYKIFLFTWLGGLMPAILGVGQFFSQSVNANKWLGLAAQNPVDIGVSVIQYLDDRWLRAYGTFGSPNAFGIYLAAIFLLGVILILKTTNAHYRLGLLLGQTIILSALFFSFSRSAYLGLIVGSLILALRNRKSILFFQQLAIYILITFILSFYFQNLLFARANLDNRLESKSISERFTQWQDFKIVFIKRPLFGVGPGNYPLALEHLHPEASNNYFSPIHNIYLFFVGQFGLVGLFFVLAGLWLVYKNHLYNFAPLVAILVSGFFDHWSISMFTGWIFLGVIFTLAIKYLSIDTNSLKE